MSIIQFLFSISQHAYDTRQSYHLAVERKVMCIMNGRRNDREDTVSDRPPSGGRKLCGWCKRKIEGKKPS